MKLLKSKEIEHDEYHDDDDMLSGANQSVKEVIQGILDQLLLLEKFVDLKSFNKLEKLNKLDHLEDLNYLKFIPNLKKDLEDLNEKLPLLEELHELGKLEPVYRDLASLDQSLQGVIPKLDKLDQFDKLDDLKELSELSKLEELHHLKALVSLDQLDKLAQLDKIKDLQHLEQLNKLNHLDHLKQLEHLKLLKKIDQFETLSKGINLSALDKLEKLDILKQERSKIWGALIIKMLSDTIRTLVVSVGLIFGFFYFAQKKEIITLTQSLLSMDAHTVNISYGLLNQLSPLNKSQELQSSFYDKAIFEVVNFWNNESFNKHNRLLALNFIYSLNKDIIPSEKLSPIKEFENIQINEMKDLDTVIKELPETNDSEMVHKAYFSRLFMDIHSGQCKESMDSLKASRGSSFISLENRLKAQALYCLFKSHQFSMTKTLKDL